jgi:protein-tyrosine phosphatase
MSETGTAGPYLEWDGVYNVRDLGGHRTAGGQITAHGALIRSDNPARLTPAGWRALRDHGVGTIVDLRDPEVENGSYQRDAQGLDLVPVSIFGLKDDAFWAPLRDDALLERFYRRVFELRSEQLIAAVRAIARARPGGVLIHCQVGKDRTGLVAALALGAAGVPTADIVEDYELTAARMPALYEKWGEVGELKASRGHTGVVFGGQTNADALTTVLTEFDPIDYLRSNGLSAEELAALTRRLLNSRD